MELYAHNRTAYEAVVSMLEQYRRAAVIHPTGTGKSFLAFQLIEGHPDARFLWLVRQKSAKKAPGKNSNCVMTPERVAKLEKIGVVWDAPE